MISKDTGHLVLWECPEQVAEDAKKFLGAIHTRVTWRIVWTRPFNRISFVRSPVSKNRYRMLPSAALAATMTSLVCVPH